MTERLKQLSIFDEAGRFRFMHVVLLFVMVKGVARPGWESTVELLVVIAACCFRWTMEPKAVTPAKPEDLATVHRVVEKLALDVKQMANRFAKFEFLEKAVPKGLRRQEGA